MGKLLIRSLPVLVAILAFGVAWDRLKVDPEPEGLSVTLELRTSYTAEHTLFFDDQGTSYNADRSVQVVVHPLPTVQLVEFDLPVGTKELRGLRYDPGTERLEQELISIEVSGPYQSVTWKAKDIVELFEAVNDMDALVLNEERGSLLLKSTGEDAYMASKVDLGPITVNTLDNVRPVLRPFVLAMLIGFFTFILISWSIRAISDRHVRPLDESPASSIRRPFFGSVAIALGVFTLTALLLNNVNFKSRKIHVDLEIVSTKPDNFQMFFAQKPGDFREGNYVNQRVVGSSGLQVLSFPMPSDTLFSHLRFDPGNVQDSLLIRNMHIRCNEQVHTYGAAELFELFHPNEDVASYTMEDRGLVVHFKGDDPFLFCDKNIGAEVKSIRERSGNGPLPFLFALVAGSFTLFTLWRVPLKSLGRSSSRTSEWGLVIGFAVLISLPLLSEVMPIQPLLEDTEKRPLAEKPFVRLHSLLDLPAKYTKYFADHFGFRKALFRMNAMFHAYVLYDSSMPHNVIFGKDGFLFLNRPGALDLYRGLPAFTEEELIEVSTRLEERRAGLAEKGIAYYLYFPPVKASVYPDKLPAYLRPVHQATALDLLIDHIRNNTRIPVIDSRAGLRAGREVRDTYYTTDMHWNPWGALIGYRDLLGRIQQDRPEVGLPCTPDDFVVEEQWNDNGDLAMQIALNDKLTRVTYMMVPHAGTRSEQLPEEDLPASAFFKYKPIFMKGPDPQAPKLLMFRDSFAVYLIPYLSEHFSRSVYVWSPVFIPDIIEKEKPDIVVQEILELFMTDLLEDKLHSDL